ncbi:MAG: methyltransferase domain-containing protein [Betaproteobacteria bacterium]|nr:methyltransferase domain-containing protein [Betaproteobacteria bacterium]
MKKSHPALAFEKAKLSMVRVAGRDFNVWMAPDIDSLLEDFISAGEQDEQLNQQRCPFGAVLWPSARGLWEWLSADPSHFAKIGSDKNDQHLLVLELGSGVGFLAALLAANTRWSVTASDYEPAYAEFLRGNCRQLGVEAALPFETLDWCEAAPVHLRHSFDLIIACDVFYDDSHLDSVPRIAAELLKPEGALLVADPERFRFQTALEKLKKHFATMTIYETSVENSREESLRTGVANLTQILTRIQLVHCQKPRI